MTASSSPYPRVRFSSALFHTREVDGQFIWRVLLHLVRPYQGPSAKASLLAESAHGPPQQIRRPLPMFELFVHCQLPTTHHPRPYEVCSSRPRVPFREPGGAIALFRKDECDTASPLRQELKNPQACKTEGTLHALGIWRLTTHLLHRYLSRPRPPLRIS